MNWSQLDPNLISVLLTAVLTALGIGGYKATATKAASVLEVAREIVGDGLEHVIDRLTVEGLAAAAQWTVARFEREAWDLLARAGSTKRPQVLVLVVHELAVWAHAELFRRLHGLASKRMAAQLDELARETAGVVDAFKAGPLVPHDGPGVERTIIETKAGEGG